jgi:LysM repeat protein
LNFIFLPYLRFPDDAGPYNLKTMMRLLSLFLSVMTGFMSVAQTGPVALIEDGKPVIRHKVIAKENWYSVARNFNLRPAEIASANALGIEKPLNIGQSLDIPLTADNFAQTGKPAGDEAFIPVYHVVQQGEGLYRIGQLYNKVGSEAVKRMSNMSSDAIRPGMRLVIGYLKVKKSQSAFAAKAVTPPVAAAEPTPPAKPAAPVSAPVSPSTTQAPPTPKAEPVKPVNPPAVTPVQPSAQTSALPAGTGFFTGLFIEQAKVGQVVTVSGNGASFKSTSGWNDGKYYVLMNGVEPGTVVKITEAAGGATVYAKVLGDLPPIRENEGLQARISNAAMAKMGLPEGTHSLTFHWNK